MMTSPQIARLNDLDLLAKIAEESSEVIKAAMKHHAHGPRPSFEGADYNNVRDLNDEFRQLESLVAEYRGRFGTGRY